MVTFFVEYTGGAYAPPLSVATDGGIAEATIILTDTGQVRCRAESGEARDSGIVTLAIQPLPTPTATASRTPSPSPTARPTSAATSTPQPVSTPALPTPAPPSTAATDQPPSGIDLLLAAGTTLAAAALGCLVLGERRKQPVIVVRWVLLAIIGGMLGYILYALRLVRPESWGILPDAGWVVSAGMVAVVALCALLPLVVMVRKPLRNRGGRP